MTVNWRFHLSQRQALEAIKSILPPFEVGPSVNIVYHHRGDIFALKNQKKDRAYQTLINTANEYRRSIKHDRADLRGGLKPDDTRGYVPDEQRTGLKARVAKLEIEAGKILSNGRFEVEAHLGPTKNGWKYVPARWGKGTMHLPFSWISVHKMGLGEVDNRFVLEAKLFNRKDGYHIYKAKILIPHGRDSYDRTYEEKDCYIAARPGESTNHASIGASQQYAISNLNRRLVKRVKNFITEGEDRL